MQAMAESIWKKRMGFKKTQHCDIFAAAVNHQMSLPQLSQHGDSLVPDSDKEITVLSAERLQNFLAITMILCFPTNPVHNLLFPPKH